jgi:hypothetical protein
MYNSAEDPNTDSTNGHDGFVCSQRRYPSRFPPVAAILALVLVLQALAACQAIPVPLLVPASTETLIPITPCNTCAPATQIAALTQASINTRAEQAQASATADILIAQALATSNAGTATQGAAMAEQEINAIALQAQAAATADILRAHALATANAASSTQGAALTQESLNASVLQAQAAATADRQRADALATYNSASSTQSSALTQAALQQALVQLHLRLTAQSATQNAGATATQQWMGARVAGTATTLARAMTNQTQSAVAIAQQREEQNQGPIVFVWKWGLPIFVVVAAMLGLWGFWRWLKMQTTRPRPVAPTVGGPLIIRERARSLAEQLPSLLRRMAWFVETESNVAAIERPVDAVVATDHSVAATPPAAMARVPASDPAIEVAQPLTPGVSQIETEAPPAPARV